MNEAEESAWQDYIKDKRRFSVYNREDGPSPASTLQVKGRFLDGYRAARSEIQKVARHYDFDEDATDDLYFAIFGEEE